MIYKILTSSILLVFFVSCQMTRAGQNVQGWIIDLNEFPLGVHRNHPGGGFDVIPEEGDEGVNFVKGLELEVNPLPATVTVLTDKEAEELLQLEKKGRDNEELYI